MYDPDLKYISISYRWGELPEQLLETPDYSAHITSFDLGSLVALYQYIIREPDLKEIHYLWLDAISVDQQDYTMKKNIILIMSDIYKNAFYILAVPDLHRRYLLNNTANTEVIRLIYKYKDTIHHAIHHSIAKKNNNDNDNDNDNNIHIKIPTSNSTEHCTNNNHYDAIIQKLMNTDRIKNNKGIRKDIEELKTKNVELMKGMDTLRKENEDIKTGIKEDELKKAYRFLAYLINDWSNRVWVISEYKIAMEKYIQRGTPLKYVFLSLYIGIHGSLLYIPFFSYTFSNYHKNKDSACNDMIYINYYVVDNSNKFINFLESKFVQRNQINMILGSNATRNGDRFYAILPSWNKYKGIIKNKNTISKWNITNTTSVKLKLYNILDDEDLWDKARLLYMSSIYSGKAIFPSFATQNIPSFNIIEIDNIDYAHELALKHLSKHEDSNSIKEYVDIYNKKGHDSIFKQNLIDIQVNKQKSYLSIKVEKYFIFKTLSHLFSKEELVKYSLIGNDDLKLV